MIALAFALLTSAQEPQLNRLVCPVSVVGAGCMRVQVNVTDGLLNIFLQNLQRPSYPGDPWISSVNSVYALGSSLVGTPGAVWSPASVGYFGQIQNISNAGGLWRQVQEWEPVQGLAAAGFLTDSDGNITQSGVAGCSSGNLLPGGIPLGYQTCQQVSAGAVALQGFMPSWLNITSLHMWGSTYNHATGERDSWVCDAAVLGHSIGPIYQPGIECDVSISTDRLDQGIFTPVTMASVTPEPGTMGLFALGLMGVGYLRRRRRVHG